MVITSVIPFVESGNINKHGYKISQGRIMLSNSELFMIKILVYDWPLKLIYSEQSLYFIIVNERTFEVILR